MSTTVIFEAYRHMGLVSFSFLQGMGKTIQTIALIVTNRTEKITKSLKPNLQPFDATGQANEEHPYYNLMKSTKKMREAAKARHEAYQASRGSKRRPPAPSLRDPGPGAPACCPEGGPLYSWSPRGEVSKTTLVVCPVVALVQWRNELLRHTADGALNVHIHHGPNR